MSMNWFKCRKYQEGISLLAINQLPKDQTVVLESHLTQCSHCRAGLVALKGLNRELILLKTAGAEILPSPQAHFRLRQALHETAKSNKAFTGAKIRRAQSQKRLLWGSLAAVWSLILFFQIDAPKTLATGERTCSLPARTLWMVLKEPSSLHKVAEKEALPQEKPQNPHPTSSGESKIPATHC